MTNQRDHLISDANWADQGEAGQSQRFRYDPYGHGAVEDTAQEMAGGDHAWHCLHEGNSYPGTTGLYHFRDRDYAPTLGRWISQDPMGYVDGMGLYEYVRSGPLGAVDPLGLRTYLSESDNRVTIHVVIEYFWDRCDTVNARHGGTRTSAERAAANYTREITEWWNAMLRELKIVRPTENNLLYRYMDIDLAVEDRFTEIDGNRWVWSDPPSSGTFTRKWLQEAGFWFFERRGHPILLRPSKGTSSVDRLPVNELHSVAGIWYYGDTTRGVAAHEAGHLLGLDDRYEGGGQGDVYVGNIMSDLTQSIWPGQVATALRTFGLRGPFKVARLGAAGRGTYGGAQMSWEDHEITFSQATDWYSDLEADRE